MIRILAAFVVLLSLVGTAHAVSDPGEMLPNRSQELRAEAIGSELRCLVCQNESVEESEAALAKDFRRIIRERVAAGGSNQEVIDWMVARYGDFIRLQPPFDGRTLLLWSAPAIAVAAGAAAALIGLRRRSVVQPAPLSDGERHRLAELLDR